MDEQELRNRLLQHYCEVIDARDHVPLGLGAIEAAIELAPQVMPRNSSLFTRSLNVYEAAAELLELASAIRSQVGRVAPVLDPDIHPTAANRIIEEWRAMAFEARGSVDRQAVVEAATRLQQAREQVDLELRKQTVQEQLSDDMFGPPE